MAPVDSMLELDEAQQLDIVHLTNRLRQLELKWAQLPKHSGRASSERRAELRAVRKSHRAQIVEARSDIVEWAICNVPVEGLEVEEAE